MILFRHKGLVFVSGKELGIKFDKEDSALVL